MHVWGVLVPIRTVFVRSNRPRGENRGKTFAGVPNCHGCQGKTTRKQSKCSAYDNTKKARLYLCSLQLLLQLEKSESRERSRREK